MRLSDVSIKQIPTSLLNTPNQAWLDAFVTRRGHAPRVLLIGNIANNAYNNAKILNQAGLDCDVICYDYYHVMSCPEWEDADFLESPASEFRPNWAKVQSAVYERPRWFAQGPMLDAIDYLISRRSGAKDQDERWRRLLINAIGGRPENRAEWATVNWCRFKEWTRPGRIRLRKWLILRHPAWHARLRSFIQLLRRRRTGPAAGSKSTAATESTAVNRQHLLVDQFVNEFPERSDRLTPSDINPYREHQVHWEYLMSLYDIVIGFSTDPFLPLLCGKAYFAVEHGTLRDIPFAADPQGRRTALAYRLAQHCFVTNFDCADNAARLAPGRYTLINHPYDEDHGLSVDGADELRLRLQRELDADFVFFHPTRQDWVEGTGYADKNNDVFLRAFAALRKRGLKVGAVICSWGANVRQSQELLAELGCSRHVHWTPPLAITPFERMCKACDAVADQFMLGAFGGVVFKAMAVGTPIVTFLNEDLIARQYPERPPVINCRTVEDIENAVSGLMLQPDEVRRIGQRSREWICRHHGKRDTINKQVDQFRHHLPIPTDCVDAVTP